MFNENGIFEGVEWSFKHIKDRTFELRVGDKIEMYEAVYPITFGLDVYDYNEVNKRLDAMQGL